ncbi:CaiB/BaiF CoA-transferase family protein [Mesorhizobium sp. J428]|uniref:CaiB/BaiF CoA transferase family protein n=1 Tax=Mesorhizobium sp. J428 TaxID=2898440 RepID=UPI0021511505|nr:CoA transferase [Mesorhizobium sp. J428]MCR5859925.1 CoA transferase [Mesorhizobium sp. J428]
MTAVLEGIRVVDFSRIFAGPDSTQILGDLGADVVKVEDPDGGDDCRYLGATKAELERIGAPSPSFRSFNRNKRSIALDLSTEAGRKAARRLALGADVVVNNFRPGTMERWGLGYEHLGTDNPRLVYCDFHAYGPVGPLAQVGANDLALQAHSGLMSITGEEGGPPARAGSAIVDLHASLAIVSGVLAALFHRERTGRGQRVDTSLLLSSAHLMSYFYQDYWLSGNQHRRMGTANHLSVPNQAFPTHDGYVVIIAPSDEMWRRLVDALSPQVLGVPEFATASERLRLRKEVVEAISSVTRTMGKHDIHALLSAAKVNVSVVHDIGEATQHPQLEAVGGIFRDQDSGARYVGTPFRLHETPGRMTRSYPALGEHTDEILAQAGYSMAEIAELRKAGGAA